MCKNVFKYRIYAMYVMVVAWVLSGPVLKTYFNLLPSSFFGIVGIWVMIIGLSQKWLRKKFSMEELLIYLVVVDILFIIGAGIINYLHDIRMMLVYDMVLDGPYNALLVASNGKLESYYLSKFSNKQQDYLRATIQNRKIYASLIGLLIGSLLPFIVDVYFIIWVKLIIMSIGVYLEIKALKFL